MPTPLEEQQAARIAELTEVEEQEVACLAEFDQREKAYKAELSQANEKIKELVCEMFKVIYEIFTFKTFKTSASMTSKPCRWWSRRTLR
jgi:hypothetical protein